MDPLASKLEFHDDGSPKRKYEIEARAEGRLALSIAVGFLLAQAFVLLKSVLFWSDASAHREDNRARPEQDRSKSTAEVDSTASIDDPVVPEEKKPDGEEDADSPKGSATNIELFSLGEAFIPEEPEYPRAHTSGRPASNDNEALYGAMPGRAVDLSDMDAAGAGPSASGGSGSGGPGADDGGGMPDGPDMGTDHPDGDNNDDEDEDDDTSRPNRLPIIAAPVIFADLYSNQSLAISSVDLLRNAHDPDGDTLSVRNLRASSGTLEQRSDGTWLFTPDLNDTSAVSFTYQVSDGKAAVAQHAFLDLVPHGPGFIEGTPAADTLIGTPNADVIVAYAGDDVVIGREGNDVIYAGLGNDRIVAGDGNDVVYGDEGDDVVFGGAGDDAIFGGPGNDLLFGEDGADLLAGEDGNDTISGGADNDVIAGGLGDDTLKGDTGNDTIDGGAGLDDIDGGDGDDLIVAGLDADEAKGGSGVDVFIAIVGDGDDIYDGGSESDTYDASSAVAAVIIDLDAGTAEGDDIGADLLASIENALGGSGDDILTASLEINVLLGGPGADLFIFGSAAAIGFGHGHRDRILDFAVGDRIDIDDISAEFSSGGAGAIEDLGLRKFVLISQGLEFTEPGQMKFKYVTTDNGPATVLEGNTDFESDVEFELEIAGTYELRDDDFHWRS